MSDPLTPDEDVVLRELVRLDTEPHQIPPELYEGFLQQLFRSCHLSPERVRCAIQGLNDKGIFDTSEEETEDRRDY